MRPLDFRDAELLVAPMETRAQRGQGGFATSAANLSDWAAQQRTLESLGASSPHR